MSDTSQAEADRRADLGRREMLQTASAVAGGLALGGLGPSFTAAAAPAKPLPKKYKKLVGTKVAEKFEDSVAVVEVDMPTLQPNEILVRNTIAAVAGSDISNTPQKFGRAGPPWDMGVESVGEIVAIGAAVTARKVGQRVFIRRYGGAYAEYRVVTAGDCFPFENVSDEFASTFGSGLVALIGLESIGRMTSNEVVYVTAAAGGVGSFVVQMAKAAGNHVIGATSKDEKLDYLRALGCDRPLNYKKEDVNAVLRKEYPKGLNIAYDTVGGTTFDTLLANLAVRGRLICAGLISEMTVSGTIAEAVTRPRIYLDLIGKSKIIGGILNGNHYDQWPAGMAKIMAMANQGKLTAQIDKKVFSGLASVREAVPYAAYGENTGKVIIRL